MSLEKVAAEAEETNTKVYHQYLNINTKKTTIVYGYYQYLIRKPRLPQQRAQTCLLIDWQSSAPQQQEIRLEKCHKFCSNICIGLRL